MSTLITLSVVVAYIAGALVFARGKLRHWRKTSTLYDPSDGADRIFYALAAVALGMIWPLALGFQWLAGWLWKPADADAARKEQMRQDRDAWRERARTTTDERERETARAIVDTLDDLLKDAR